VAEDDDQKGDDRREPGESEKQRVDRELIELLNELRVVLPGVQVLFAFLLTVPFSNGFSRMTNPQRNVFFIAFLTATVATVLLIAPSTYHRIMFRQGEKKQMLFTSNRLVIVGTMFLAVSMASSVYVITDALFQVPTAAAVSFAAAAAFALLWYLFPLYRRRRVGGKRGEVL
jgi:Family of unknown function (DUF6328)